ncbi:FK506-binding protein-like WAF-1/CIP1 stabilizing protein 39 [Channa argus]|uniref:FK506-binding protein-like WAF-1/CIP1 stabilizing protein 39 n=1 Tax=Channa argus TaxID=215402 RepID=A0A6G1Q2R3_CHAAH|nr:FK506-binding protein-like WAF-1/CIP1 stabilizing protein 39 [Channa argus]
MDPVHPLETLRGTGDHDSIDVISWVSVCPRGLYSVQQKKTYSASQHTVRNSGVVTSCSSGCRPKLGSLCQVRVQINSNMDETESLVSSENEKPSVTEVAEAVETAFPRCQHSVLQVPLGDWTTLRLGVGQCDITEACLERMRAGEKCVVFLSPVVDETDQPAEEDLPLCATVELQAFTPGKDSWEMSPDEKWEWVRSHKQRGGERFRNMDLFGALDSYSRALKLLIPLHCHVRELEKKEQEVDEEQRDDCYKTQHLPTANEFRTIKAELHSNLSLCQLKLNQPERAKANAAKAAELEPGGTKAWYRLGQACQMVNELEEAKQAFRKLLELQPDSPVAIKALRDITSRQKASNAQLGLRLSKMFS